MFWIIVGAILFVIFLPVILIITGGSALLGVGLVAKLSFGLFNFLTFLFKKFIDFLRFLTGKKIQVMMLIVIGIIGLITLITFFI